MSSYEFRIAIIGMLGGFSIVWGMGYLIYAWIKSRGQRGLPEGAASELREQLSHLQMSVDTMSVEIERISEAQRFTTKVLTERSQPVRIDRGGQAQ